MEAPEEKRTAIWRLAGIRWKLSRNLFQIRLSVRYTDKRIERGPRNKSGTRCSSLEKESAIGGAAVRDRYEPNTLT